MDDLLQNEPQSTDIKTPSRFSRSKKLWWIVGLLLLVVVVSVAALYSDLLGVRVIGRGGSRVAASQGEVITFKLATSNQIRKLEICTEKRNVFTSSVQYINCRSLVNFVRPRQVNVAVTIPRTMPLGRAAVITRLRNAQGKLLPMGPSDEKIALLIAKAKPATIATSGSDGGGSGGGGGGGSKSGGGNNNPSLPPESTSTSLAEFIVPADQGAVPASTELEVRVGLTNASIGSLTCQDWFLDGGKLDASAWVGDQLPNSNLPSCP